MKVASLLKSERRASRVHWSDVVERDSYWARCLRFRVSLSFSSRFLLIGFFFHSMFVTLMLWEGRRNMVNYVTVDPGRLSVKLFNTANPVKVVTVAPLPNACSGKSELAQFVSLGVVDSSNIVRYLEKGQVSFKAVHIMLPGIASNRLQSVIHLALGYQRSVLRSQTNESGFEFSTRRE